MRPVTRETLAPEAAALFAALRPDASADERQQGVQDLTEVLDYAYDHPERTDMSELLAAAHRAYAAQQAVRRIASLGLCVCLLYLCVCACVRVFVYVCLCPRGNVAL